MNIVQELSAQMTYERAKKAKSQLARRARNHIDPVLEVAAWVLSTRLLIANSKSLSGARVFRRFVQPAKSRYTASKSIIQVVDTGTPNCGRYEGLESF